MSLAAAFLGIVIIWTTTPLTIKWSAEGAGFLFAVSSRMLIGLLVCLLIMRLRGLQFIWDKPARQTYLAAGLGIYGSMLSVYWGALHIPSGWISVIFGLVPVVTAVLSVFFLGERALSFPKVTGMALGLTGLVVMFGHGAISGSYAAAGVAAVLLSVALHSFSAVWVKRVGAILPAMLVTTGGLLVSTPLFVLTWLIFDGAVSTQMPVRAMFSIVYLGIFGSALGFLLYYHVLRKTTASQTGLITLVTPVTALFAGRYFNQEVISLSVWLGTILILSGLVVYQWSDVVFRMFVSWRVSPEKD